MSVRWTSSCRRPSGSPPTASRPCPICPKPLRVHELELTSGNMGDGYRLLGTGRLPGEGGAVRPALEGVVNPSGAQISVLELDAGQQRRVRLSGDVAGRTARRQRRAGVARLSWRRLYPEIEEPPVTLRELNAQVQYDNGNYLGNRLVHDRPAGDFTLASPVSGNLEAVHLPQLSLRAGQGSASGSLSVGFADGIDWSADRR